MIRVAADICKYWMGISTAAGQDGEEAGASDTGVTAETIAVVCRDRASAAAAAKELSKYVDVIESDPEKAVFESGIMVLPVEYTKGLEFDAVLIMNPTREDYPVDDGHAKLLYVAATRALHELCVLHTGNLTGLIADPVHVQSKAESSDDQKQSGKEEPTAHLKPSRVQSPAISVKKFAVLSKKEKTIASQTQENAQSIKKAKPAITDRPIETASTPAVNSVKEHRNNGSETMQQEFEKSVKISQADNDIRSAANIKFGDMPATEKLRPPGHGKIDLAVRWVAKQQDGLYLHSRYGILRLSPIGSAIVRVTFAKGGQITDRIHDKIAVHSVDKRWMYKESGPTVDLMTDELLLQTDKSTGAIRYMTRDKKLLLAERSRECRQLENGVAGKLSTWFYPEWKKNENVYAMGTAETAGMNLRKGARYISHDEHIGELPFILSDQGYGIVIAADGPVISCDIPAYGTYIHTENEAQIDFYFITGKRQSTIMNAYAYLCGKL